MESEQVGDNSLLRYIVRVASVVYVDLNRCSPAELRKLRREIAVTAIAAAARARLPARRERRELRHVSHPLPSWAGLRSRRGHAGT